LTIASRFAAAAASGLAACIALSPVGALAQTKFIDEVKFGVLKHDVTMFTTPVETGIDLNVEALFTPLFTPIDFYGIGISLRPEIGANISTHGQTSDGYFGLTVGFTLVHDLFRPGDAIFLNGSFSGDVHDGFLTNAPPGRKAFGSRFLGRREGELGYQVTPMISVSAIIDHIGNYGFAKPDQGMKTAGARIGFKF
jgi:lipid A 3-O-deacylase